MQKVLVAGGGKIGALIGTLLAQTQDYQAHIADILPQPHDLDTAESTTNQLFSVTLDVMDQARLQAYVQEHGINTVISCLPYHGNIAVARCAKALNLHYFDLTEDIEVSKEIKILAKNAQTIFMPQCGVAPGFISIAANALMERFEQVQDVFMRVGALPAYPHNAFKYALTWSTEGLINEYGNPCLGLEDGKMVWLQPLEGLESIAIDGLAYEAFNTSGGLGTLTETKHHKARNMNYKTLRYPGHCEKMRLLMNELKLNDDRTTLKTLLERALPRTKEDVVIIYVAVNGKQNDEFFEEIYVQKIYPQWIAEKMWSAIQVATASSACAVMDLVLNQPGLKGFITQESLSLNDFLNNRFGQYYRR